jgi:hypothetical protein
MDADPTLQTEFQLPLDFVSLCSGDKKKKIAECGGGTIDFASNASAL